jgi:cytochrome b561
MSTLHSALGWLWRKRRWFYVTYVVIALARIPARTGFRLVAPACDMRLTMENAELSLTKIPHIVLFGFFFLLTVAQFDQVDRRALSWSLLATAIVGLLVEIEEGATRTGNCRFTDVLPDLLGGLVVAAFLMVFVIINNRMRRT